MTLGELCDLSVPQPPHLQRDCQSLQCVFTHKPWRDSLNCSQSGLAQRKNHIALSVAAVESEQKNAGCDFRPAPSGIIPISFQDPTGQLLRNILLQPCRGQKGA